MLSLPVCEVEIAAATPRLLTMESCTAFNAGEKSWKFFLQTCDDFVAWSRKNKLMNSRAAANLMYIPTEYEHWANTMSHASMIIPSILGSELLIWRSQAKYATNDAFKSCDATLCSFPGNHTMQPTYAAYEFCSRAYGASLVGLFIVSSLFHWISWTQSCWKKKLHAGCCVRRPSLNKVFHICDRTTIYFFIAGSYSPWLMLHEIHHGILWLQWAIWVAAVVGTMYTFMFLEKYKLLETILYVVVGVVPGAAAFMLNPVTSSSARISELAIGGSFYIVGVLFFKCDGLIPFAHAIWHLFVAAGAFSHFFSIYKHFYAF